MKRKKRNIFIITFLLVVLFIYVIFTGIKKTSVYYFTFDEFYKKRNEIGERIVRISGNVIKNSVNFKEGIGSFYIGNERESLRVIYKGALPDLIYQDSAKVVVEGFYDKNQNIFNATFLMAQCPSKYKSKFK